MGSAFDTVWHSHLPKTICSPRHVPLFSLDCCFSLIILSMHSVHCFQIPTYWFSQFMVQHSHIPFITLGLNVFIIISNVNSFKNTLEMPVQTLQKRTGLLYQLGAVIILPFKLVILKDTVC